MNDITKNRQPNLPATPSDNPWLEYGIEAATAGASFLRFDRDGAGFSYGSDSIPLPLGTRLRANMAGVRVGWIKWEGGRPEKALMLMTERGAMTRADLGDNDKQYWENGDPWKEAAEIELTLPDGTSLTYSPSSFGGVKAVKKLCYEYGKEVRARPGQAPIVELGSSFYPHPKFQKVWEPQLNLVGWVDEEEAPALAPYGDENARGKASDAPDLSGDGASAIAERQPGEDDGVDDIPFDPPMTNPTKPVTQPVGAAAILAAAKKGDGGLRKTRF